MARLPKNSLAFTDRALAALKPGPERVDYMESDPRYRGFGIMVRPSGTKTFVVRYRVGRKERRVTLGNFPALRLTDARQQAKTVISRVALGEDPQEVQHELRAAGTFGDVAERYLAEKAKPGLKARSYREEERILRHDLLPEWRNLPVTEVRKRDVAQLLDRILARGARVQANRTRGVAHRVFAFAEDRELVPFNPVGSVRRPSKERSRQRVLSEAEIRSLWTAWADDSSPMSALFRMLLVTAQRKQEVASMRWADIEGSWWNIPAGIVKNSLAHRVYLTSGAHQLLLDLRNTKGEESEWIFASSRRQGQPLQWINKAAKRYEKLTGVAAWRPHDLRRTAATFMGRLGFSRYVIAKVLNHAERGVTAIYDRSSGEPEIERALQAWNKHLDEILRGDTARRAGQTP